MSETIDRCVQNPITNPTSVTLAQISAYATTCSTQATLAGSHSTNAAASATGAASSAVDAAVSAASVDIPTISTGDAYKYLQVKSDESGYDHVAVADAAAATTGDKCYFDHDAFDGNLSP